jgi:hypothetical protein
MAAEWKISHTGAGYANAQAHDVRRPGDSISLGVDKEGGVKGYWFEPSRVVAGLNFSGMAWTLSTTEIANLVSGNETLRREFGAALQNEIRKRAKESPSNYATLEDDLMKLQG